MENENIKKKYEAKEKIILFVIGVLLGAVVSTATFFVYVKTLGVNNNSDSSMQTPSGTPPEMPSSENGQNSQNGTPPEKPSESNSESNS